MRQLDSAFDVGDVLLSTAEKGEIRVNLGDADTKLGYAINVPVWGPDGYISRPNDPEDGACRAVYFVDGHNRRVLATCDNRFAKQAGTLKPGDRMIVTRGAPRFYMKAEDQRVGFYTESKDAPAVGGKGMMVDLNGATGTVIVKHGGRIVQFGDDGSVSLICAGQAAQSSIVMTPTTVTITASQVNIAGQVVALGINSDGTMPGKPGVDTVTIGAMGQTAVSSPKVYAAQY